MPHYGAGAATFDASGNITSVSDERVKRNIRPFMRGLADVLKLKPILHGYTLSAGSTRRRMTTPASVRKTSRASCPKQLAGEDGMLSLSDRAILAAVVNAIHELERRP